MELLKTILKDSPNLKAYYRFESGALTTDSAGAYTLTNNNTVGEGTGKFGGAADFGSANTTKSFSIANAMGITSASSFSLWVKISTNPTAGQYQTLVRYDNAGQDVITNVIYQHAGGSLQLYFQRYKLGVGEAGSVTYNVDLADSLWHHITYTFDGTSIRPYLDGKYLGVASATGTGTSALSDNLEICNGDSNTRPFKGLIDDLAIFNTALSADQIKELYEGRNLGELRPQTGLVALYHLNGNSTDFSGNNNHGTDTNITYGQAYGRFGQGASIPSNGRIALPAGFTLSGACAIGFWVKPGNYTGDGYVFTSYTGSATGNGLGIMCDANEVFSIGVNDNTKTISTPAGLSQSALTYIVFVINGSSSAIYLNGSVVATGTLATLVSNTNAFRFNGRWTSGSTGDAVQGAFCLDEAHFWNRAPTAAEIRKIYALGMGRLE